MDNKEEEEKTATLKSEDENIKTSYTYWAENNPN